MTQRYECKGCGSRSFRYTKKANMSYCLVCGFRVSAETIRVGTKQTGGDE